MQHFRLALIGFGNVGQALARLLLRKSDALRPGLTYSVCGIATGRHGSALDPNGLDLEEALARISDGRSLAPLSERAIPSSTLEFIRLCNADVLFENTPVNYDTGQPATDHLRAALKNGMHAITANKGPVVHAYPMLSELAASENRRFYFESTVMDGAPIFSLFRDTLPAADLQSFRGLLNSTTNLILTRMEAGESFDQAVAFAQSIGIAETDPSGDIDGWDAAIKVSALVTVLMGETLKPAQVVREGIGAITPEEIESARAEGKRWKLVCQAQRENGQLRASVGPEKVGTDSPLYGVSGTGSIVQFETDVLGTLSVREDDPSPNTTAYGLFADFLNAVRD